MPDEGDPLDVGIHADLPYRNAIRTPGGAPCSRALGSVAEMKTRCAWAGSDPLYVRYHDEEWGIPVHDDRRLFEFLVLEGAQAGLSWITILRKREGYARAFSGFDAKKIARYDARKVARLMADESIVRNRLKIESTISNAKAFLAVQKEFGSFDAYVWSFVGGKPKVNRPRAMNGVPARTLESDAMSKDLKKRGFRFVGSTICYAFMQACGLVDDHVEGCFRARARRSRP
jgi:DNA-3-methyladenine glycosylase I